MVKIEILEMKLKERDLEIIALKDALFMRNQMIQNLDKKVMDIKSDNEDLENENKILVHKLKDIINFNNKLHIKNREQRNKVLELVKFLKENVIICKEKKSLKSEYASYWLGAENACLQIITSVKREFELKEMCYKDTSKECTENCKGQCRQSM